MPQETVTLIGIVNELTSLWDRNLGNQDQTPNVTKIIEDALKTFTLKDLNNMLSSKGIVVLEEEEGFMNLSANLSNKQYLLAIKE